MSGRGNDRREGPKGKCTEQNARLQTNLGLPVVITICTTLVNTRTHRQRKL